MSYDILNSAALTDFLKEIQTRFFFICAGAFVFIVLFSGTLNFSKDSVMANTTALSGLFILYVLGISFCFYFVALLAEYIRGVVLERQSEQQWLAKLHKLSDASLKRIALNYFLGVHTLTNDGKKLPQKTTLELMTYRFVVPHSKQEALYNADFVNAAKRSDAITELLSQHMKTRDLTS